MFPFLEPLPERLRDFAVPFKLFAANPEAFEKNYIMTDADAEEGWQAADVLLAGTSVMKTGLAIEKDKNIGEVRIVLTSALTEVAGNVSSSAGGSDETGSVVLMFSEDRTTWFNSTGAYVRAVRADERGNYRDLRGDLRSRRSGFEHEWKPVL